METFQKDGIEISVNRQGATDFTKVSYPIRYGRFSEIKTKDYVFQFNLNGEIKYIQGRNESWPHPNEWLKRNAANDWIYYSSAGYKGTYSFIGEYYLPCFSYSRNAIYNSYFFDPHVVDKALNYYKDLFEHLKRLSSNGMPLDIKTSLKCISENDLNALKRKGQHFNSLINGRITVLPPDTRHVDYDVIPIIATDGCLYNCGFCSVKTGRDFKPRSRPEIIQQIKGLKEFYGSDTRNYNSIFLGMHDALNAGGELIEFAVKNAYEIFEIEYSNMRDPRLFFFGSVDSLLSADEALFESLDRMPFYTYINIGMESADQETLDALKKPVSKKAVEKAFERMLDINRSYKNIEITANFVMGGGLPEGHYASISDLAAGKLDRFFSKGVIYLSPMSSGWTTRDLQRRFVGLKNISRLPVYIYLIQRL